MLVAEKHWLLEEAAEETLSSLEIGLIGDSATLALAAISLFAYVIYGAVCQHRATRRITKRIKAQAGLPCDRDID